MNLFDPPVYVVRVTAGIGTLLWLFTLLSLTHESLAGPHEKRLLNDLLGNYNVLERPVANESEPLLLSFGLTLQQIIDVDEKNQIITTNLWLNLDWVDVNLRWDPAKYGGVSDLRIPPHRIWKPDILMYNSADEKFDGTYPTNVVVRSNGSCNYIPPGIFKSTCKINIRWFPFDDQMCQLKFGSWTYAGLQLDLRLNSDDGGDLATYIPNGEWDLLELPGERNVITYTCCPEPYIDITYTIKIRRRTLYYGVNLIIPCVLISSMTLLGFTLPPDTGERLTLGVTILLSLTVFMLQLAEALPPVSDAVSIIGTYFACIMMMVAFSVVMTVLVLNYHHRNKECAEMPKVVRSIFLVWLPWLLRMQVPASLRANLERRQSMPESNASPSFRSSAARRMFKELELKERSSRSLLANVLDLEDDFRPSNAACYLHPPPPPRSQPPTGAGTSFRGSSASARHHRSYHDIASDPMDRPSTSASSSMANQQVPRELQTIMVDLRYITDKMRKDEEEHEVVSEWRFAAKVIDRVCFLFFSAFTAISTIACLFSAPHLYA